MDQQAIDQRPTARGRLRRRNSASAVSEVIYATFLRPGNAMSKVITMASHPVGCDVALKVIEIVHREDFTGCVRHYEDRHLSRLGRLGELPSVRDVRGRGRMWGVKFDGPYAAKAPRARAKRRCLAAGLRVLRAHNMIRINPLLTASDEDIAFVVETLDAAVRDLAAD